MHPDISCPDAFVVRPMKNFLTVCLLTLFVAASCSRERGFGQDGKCPFKFYIQTSNLYDSLGFFDKALEAYKKYSDVSGSLDLVIFSQDTKFIEDKYEKSLQITNARNSRTVIILISLLVTFFLAYAIHQMLKALKKRESEKEMMERQIELYKKNYSDLKLRYFRSLHLLIPYGRCTSGAGDILARHRLSRPVCRRLFCRGMTLQYEEFQ